MPDDYAEQIRALRRARGVSQVQLATLVGAARKAVVYQWEARKRCPSPVFWQRITVLHRRLPERPEAGTHQKVEQGQERADHGGHVGERGGVQHAVHTPPLALTDDPVRHHEFLRAGSRRPLVITSDQDRVGRDRILSLLTTDSSRLRSLCLTRAWGFESPLPHH